MDDRNILLITSTGLVGGNLQRVLDSKGISVAGTYYPAVDKPSGLSADIVSDQSVREVFLKAKPSVVILNAALTNVEFCEENPDVARKVNVTGTENVVRACQEFGAKLVFFSSDYVFDGVAGPYAETDVPHPISVYGATKWEAESLIQEAGIEHLIIRTTVVYGYEAMGKNFCYRLINTLKAGEKIRVPADQVGSPTYAYNLAEVVADLVEKRRRGVYNVVGRDLVDRYEFSRRVCRVFGLDERLLVPVTTAELKQKAPRPLKAGLCIDKVQKDSAVSIMGIEDSLQSFKKELYG